MQALARLVRSRWVTTLIAAVVVAVLIWFFGPMLGVGVFYPLATEVARIIAIALVVVVFLAVNIGRGLRARAREKKLAAGVLAPDADATASAEELALLGDRLRDALAALRRAKLGGRSRRHLYELPWYMLIGPPGSGKTTALVNSGLTFPLAETREGKPVQGVGGTRNCDWWFTDDAVLIDTAGRYTTQDSNEKVDGTAWTGFLRLLKKHRKRQPLNGVLLAISLSDLATLEEGERLAHARAMRNRVRELHDELGVRLPVYVLFTKADTTVGFNEFFDNLGREERDQVWGITLPLDDGKDEGGAVAHVPAEFDLLLGRLNERMLERLQQETDQQRRRLIYGFPQQVASLREVAVEFLGEIFRPSRLEARSLLRGVYFTSGTQDGTSIDRLMGAMAASFGLQRQAVTAWSGTGRSYFLGRLVREVVFGEAGLVGLDPKEERRRRWLYRAAYAGCAVVLVGMTASWAASYAENHALVAQVGREAQRYQDEFAAVAKRGANDTDLPAILPPLATLRTMPGGYEDRDDDAPLSAVLGLYQGRKLGNAAIDAYHRALGGLLQPRLLARLEGELAANMDKPDFLYEALKAYLILGRQGPLDAETVEGYFQADLAAGFPGDDDEPTREALLAHLHAMMERPLAAVPINDALVARAREVLNREPLAEYSYNRLMRSKSVRDLPEWTVADKATPGGSRIFVLRSGKPLGSGVPGIYTWAGFHSTFKGLLGYVSVDVSENSWVLGKPEKGLAASAAAASKLPREVVGLYLDDYTRRWDAMIADIALQPFGDMPSALDKMSLIGAPESPFRNLLKAIDVETQLSRAAPSDAVEDVAKQKADKVGKRLSRVFQQQSRGLGSREQNMMLDIVGQALGDAPPGGGAKPVDPVTRVDEHFAGLHRFVAGAGAEGKGTPPLEMAIVKINDIYQSLNQAASAANPGQVMVSAVAGGGGAGGAAAAALQEVAKDAPKPVATMLQAVASGGASVQKTGASKQIADAWTSKVLPLCNEAFNRYPFKDGSRDEVPPADFARLLGPGGLVDTFFNENLKPFVDTTKRPWRAQGNIGISTAALAQFENAALIRDALFTNGGLMQVGFSLRQGTITPEVAMATIDIAGQTMVSQNGPPELQHFQWPGANGKTLVLVTMKPATGGNSTVVPFDGPWALLRWLDSAEVKRGSQDRLSLTLSGGGGSASFELTADSVRNVFTLGPLRSFRCPATL